jgi:16S rRNA (adenine1518-N6/adenine1519-N6)-dimethyltransferase
VDQRVATAIVRAAKLDANRDVLEVGPGLGALTTRLTRAARRVVAVELDSRLAERLRDELAQSPPVLTVVNRDILEVDPADYFEGPYTVVANLPYHITSPALRHLLRSGPPYAQRLVVMVQAEVAERIAAEPGAMSALAVSIQSQARVRTLRKVPADAFYPRPKVDSAVLLLEAMPEAEREISREELAAFTTLVQAGFRQPRKTLANSLAEGLGAQKPVALRRLEAAQIDHVLRPQALTIEDWVRLFRAQ